MKTLIFELSMPNVASWDGRWSGADRPHTVTRRVTDKRAAELLERGYWSYGWDDGWRAGVTVTESSGAAQTRKAAKLSAGFAGYGWMVDSIVARNKIVSGTEETNAL